MKNILCNSDKDPIVVEIYKEYKKIKKTETKNKEENMEQEKYRKYVGGFYGQI